MAGKKKVMLIDDDEVSNFIGTTMIERSEIGGEVHTFQNAEEAVKYLRSSLEIGKEGLPDIIFLDLNMPVMDGWEFLEEYRKTVKTQNVKIPIIILTSSVYQLDLEKARQYEVVDDFASKPLTLNVLNDLNKRYLS